MMVTIGSIAKNKYIKLIARFILPSIIAKKITQHIYKNRNIRIIFGSNDVVVNTKTGAVDGVLPVVYWDGTPNFGDIIGPYLISKISGKPVLNILDSKRSGIMTVGSILNLLDRDGMTVWGSGLIETPTTKLLEKIKSHKPKVLSVRGRETARHLEQVGIKVENMDALGDPALIMPLFYTPDPKKNSGKVAICPHYTHKEYFQSVFHKQEDLDFIDVQKGLEKVISKISSSRACVSTSLHGLIISQAYGVPWVWLEITDNNLKGDDFKFKDFFSTLNSEKIAHVRVSLQDLVNLKINEIAAQAALPEKRYSEELILSAIKEQLPHIIGPNSDSAESI